MGRKRERTLFRRTAPSRQTSLKRYRQRTVKIPGLREDYYLAHIEEAKGVCENCGDPIPYTHEWQAFTAQAHILPKEDEKFPEVALVYENHWEGCLRCHNTFDSVSAAVVKEMPVIPVLKERLAKFIHLVKPDNLKKIPEYLTENT